MAAKKALGAKEDSKWLVDGLDVEIEALKAEEANSQPAPPNYEVIKRLSDQIRDRKTKLSKISTELAEAERRYKDTKKRRNQIKRELRDLRQKIDECPKEFEDIVSELSDTSSEGSAEDNSQADGEGQMDLSGPNPKPKVEDVDPSLAGLFSPVRSGARPRPPPVGDLSVSGPNWFPMEDGSDQGADEELL